jgi:diadenosine tetraphosphate (Ap4A) HIT family hydrolase
MTDVASGSAGCRTCELTARRDAGSAPPWDLIYRTDGWDVVHAYDTSLPGWLVLVLRRRLTSIADLTDEEAMTLGRLIRDASAALVVATGCAKTYVAQFAEHPLHPHVHFHVVPRPPDLPDDQVGPAVFARLGVAESERVPEAEMNRVAAQIRNHLVASAT